MTGEQTSAAPLRPRDPRRLGDYELVGRLGEGGMGTVYLARTPAGVLVAVKVVRADLAPDDEFRRRFRSEVNRVRQVPPFCTAEVLDADPDHETPYLVVEFVDGPSLADVVQDRGPLTSSHLHSVAIGVATALSAIHGAGVIHRDLKPRNVLLAPGSPKVIDFGIARAMEATSGHTSTDQMVGTVAYMAPERFGPDPGTTLTPAADIFAWGGVVAFAGTGRTPFRGDSPPATAARILTQPPDLSGLKGQLRDLVAYALEKDPSNRPDARELLDLLVTGPQRPAATTAALNRQPGLRAAAREAQAATGYNSKRQLTAVAVPPDLVDFVEPTEAPQQRESADTGPGVSDQVRVAGSGAAIPQRRGSVDVTGAVPHESDSGAETGVGDGSSAAERGESAAALRAAPQQGESAGAPPEHESADAAEAGSPFGGPVETNRTGLRRSGSAKAGQGRAGSVEAGRGRAGSGEAGQGRAGSGEAGLGRAGSGEAGQGRAGSAQAGQRRSRPADGETGLRPSDSVDRETWRRGESANATQAIPQHGEQSAVNQATSQRELTGAGLRRSDTDDSDPRHGESASATQAIPQRGDYDGVPQVVPRQRGFADATQPIPPHGAVADETQAIARVSDQDGPAGRRRRWSTPVIAALAVLAVLAVAALVMTARMWGGSTGGSPLTVAPSPVTAPLIDDVLDKPWFWESSKDDKEKASCAFTGGALVVRRETKEGSYRCRGPLDPEPNAVRIDVNVRLLSKGSCAGIWFRFRPFRGYQLRVCETKFLVGTHKGADAAVTRTFPLGTPVAVGGAATKVTLLVHEDTVEVFRDDVAMGSVPLADPEITDGRVVLGIFTEAQDPGHSPPYAVAFDHITVRPLS